MSPPVRNALAVRLTLLVALILVLLAACSTEAPPAPMSATAELAGSPVSESPMSGQGPLAPTDAEKTDTTPTNPDDTSEAQLPVDRMVIKEAQLILRTPSPETLATKSAELAARYGGFVVKSEASHVEDKVVKSDVTLRVRAESLDAALEDLRTLGEVLNESVTGEDVSAEFVDVQARLKAKRVLESRMLAIAAQANAVDDMLKVETELSRVRSDIEQLQGRSRLLRERTRLSLIRVTAQSPSQPTVGEAESFGSKLGGAFARALRLAGDVVVGLVVLAGFLTPLLVLALLAAAPVVWYVRRRRRTARAQLAAMYEAASAQPPTGPQVSPQPPNVRHAVQPSAEDPSRESSPPAAQP